MNPTPNILLLTNGRVYTGAPKDTPRWENALLICDGKIVAVGDDALAAKASERIDLDGALVLPGLCDAHLHLAAGGQSLGIPDLSKLNSDGIKQELRSVLSRIGGASDSWIEAFNWDEDLCPLNADILELWAPGVPLVVHKRDLHGCCCNRTALERAGITDSAESTHGSRFGRSGNGRLTGMLFESAVGLLLDSKPKPSDVDQLGHILKGQSYVVRRGITAIGEVLERRGEDLYRQLDADGRLKIEVDGWLRVENWDGSAPPPPGNRFRMETLKLFLDGSFGSRTAALFDPFADGEANTGELLYGEDELKEISHRAASLGWRLAMHAIGDHAVAQACRILVDVPKATRGRHRIEHLQLLPVNGLDCVVRSGAAASVQPIHLIDDQNWLLDRIGPERCRRSFLWRTFLRRGVPLPIGSDWPVAPADPILNIHTAINRAAYGVSPRPEFPFEEALTPAEAIRCATYEYALVAGLEHRRGAILPGFDADLTVVRNAPADLRDWSAASVQMTISRGEILYDTLSSSAEETVQ